MKLTTPRALFMGLLSIAAALLLRVDDQVRMIPEARAEVAGMDSYDLQSDYDFSKAVKSVIDGECFVEEGDPYVYC